jgi:hypothetical protein
MAGDHVSGNGGDIPGTDHISSFSTLAFAALTPINRDCLPEVRTHERNGWPQRCCRAISA